MAIIDVLKWEAAPGVFAWKYPSTELSTWTQLIVAESQEACLFKEGKIIGPFPPGRHTLSTDNYPLLKELFKVPFGRSPFTAEVWYVQRAFKLDIKWGTLDPIQLEDPKYKIMLPVRAFGQYGLRVEDSSKFLIKLVGTLPAFTQKTMNDYFKGFIVTHSKDIIAKYLVEKNVSILHISASLAAISECLKDKLTTILDEYGVGLASFLVNSISTDDNDPAVVQLKAALAKKAEMDIVGYNYQQMRSFDTMEAAASNTGGGQGGLMGAGIGFGLGMGAGGGMGAAMGQMAQQIKPNGVACSCGRVNEAEARFCAGCGKTIGATAAAPKEETLVCDKCGSSAPKGSKFCLKCGDPFFCCSSCGTDNPSGSLLCRNCGNPLPVVCGKCGATVPGGVKFCGECGGSLVKKCSECQAELTAGVKFCGTCGKKTDG
jgi:membrane protease subunit (stomatin/prohibitin family)